VNSPSLQNSWLYETLRSSLYQDADGTFHATYRDYRLSSHFQPIVSLTHARVIGHEGLIRPVDASSQRVSPLKLLRQTEDNVDELLKLDRLCRLLHMANAGEGKQGWLFLNMHPRVFAIDQQGDLRTFSTKACSEFGFNREHIVIELLEHSLQDEAEFTYAVQNIHEQGYLVALDDFGAGHSNFDRVWKISPEIVKLDRIFAMGVENDPRIRRLLPRIVALLHEAGVFVLLEGIETRKQAMIALDANIDFAQGDYFGEPQAAPLKIHSLVDAAAELWQKYDSQIVEQQSIIEIRLKPYKTAMLQAVEKIAASVPVVRACSAFLSMPYVEMCYLLDGNGRQIGSQIWHPAYSIDQLGKRFQAISNIGGARWSRRPYFRSAIENFGSVQATQPYLSISSGHVCITVSLAFHIGNERRVICGDIVWE
jgi:EAL domain-containing protein (putative c-di-GMP-specific phosphodiesterase class I)